MSRWTLSLAWWAAMLVGAHGVLVLLGYWAGYGGRWTQWSNVGPPMSPSTATSFVILATAVLIGIHARLGQPLFQGSSRVTC